MSVVSLQNKETDPPTEERTIKSPRYERRDYKAIKRAFDIAVSLALLVLGFPIFLTIALLILLTDGGPVLFRQRRVGHEGEGFWMYKFRTMKRNAESLLNADPALLAEYKKNFKLENDPRLLPCGKVLRSFSLDELPQLVNVLRGDMSIVGPRPLIPSETDRYGESIDVYNRMKPGCAGLWQHRGRNDLTFEDRVALDVEYYETASIRRDVMVLLHTAVAIVQRKGAM